MGGSGRLLDDLCLSEAGWDQLAVQEVSAPKLSLRAETQVDGRLGLRPRQGAEVVVLEHDVFAVPEPATWAMMIIGFGAVGSMVRTSRRRNAAVPT